MIPRVRLDEIASRLTAELPAVPKIGTCYDVDYLKSAGKGEFPQVWVVGQRMARQGDGVGAQDYTQQMAGEILVLVAVGRYAVGETQPEGALHALVGEVTTVLANWTPPSAWRALRLERVEDGTADESFLTCRIVFTAGAIHRRTP